MRQSGGSIWRLWDLHVHTPYSILNNSFPKWDDYIKTLFTRAIELNVQGIGITDYYTIEGYKKIRKEYLENDAKLSELFNPKEIEEIKKITVIPNIEFRINKLVIGKDKDLTWNRKVNLHLLLSDKLDTEDIENNILNRLTFEHTGVGQGKSQALPITKKNFIDIGNKLMEVQPEFTGKDPLWVGMVNASIDDAHLVNIIDENQILFKSKYLIGICADEDLSQVHWGSSGHLTRKVLIQKSHFIFSSNRNTRTFLLGKKHSSIKEYKNEFNTLKPCIWGSDSHDASKLLLPDFDNFTWIKSDCTFEGLRQIIFEPEERVRIQKDTPELKIPYQIIEKVRFIDHTKRNFFDDNWIYMNPNLNTIIGGKSSGKSLLLYHIAKSISKDYVGKQMEIVPNSFGYEIFIDENPFDFEVQWGNGNKNVLASQGASTNQITYIPQLFINQLAEKKGELYLNHLVESILEQNENYKNLRSKTNLLINGINTSIESLLSHLFFLREQALSMTEQIKKVGDKGNIEKEIARLEGEIQSLRQESGFSETESLEYLRLLAAKNVVELRRNKFQQIYDQTSLFSNDIEEHHKSHIVSITDLFDQLNFFDSTIIHSIKNDVLNRQSKLDFQTIDSLSTYASRILSRIVQIKARAQDISNQLIPYHAKIKNQEKLNAQLTSLENEKGKLVSVELLITEKQKVYEKGVACRKEILTKYEELFSLYKSIKSELNNNFKVIGDQLELFSELYFDQTGFNQFVNAFDRRTRLNKVFEACFNDDDQYLYSEENHISKIDSIFLLLKDIDKLGIRMKAEFTKEQIHKFLFSDYFKFKYSIRHNSEDIIKMSPGKKGLVLLQLILHLSNASHPILIDQPEDNLDNRTIYFQLKNFIREKKVFRQIIIVTHNANLIVSTDAENIIVANQDGQQAGKDNMHFKFEYVSGGLENTFTQPTNRGILFQMGIREHVCDILEGGKEAFQEREEKYGFK